MNRRISQALSIIFSKRQKRGTYRNSLLLLLPMGLGDAIMFLDSIDYYFDAKEYNEIIIMSTGLAKKVFDYARPKLRYTFIEYSPMEMDTNFKVFLKCLNALGKTHYKKIVYPLRGFLTMDLLFKRLSADEKICIDTIRDVKLSTKVKVREKLISGSQILRVNPSDMDLIRYAKIASQVLGKDIKSRIPKISFVKEVGGKKYIQISVGSSRPEKCWPIERYRDIVKYILMNTDYDIVFTGSMVDKRMVETVIFSEIESDRIRNICGETSLEELFSIIGNATLLIGPDSGPIHVATALNTPAICIVGGWDYERVYPYKVDIYEKGRCTPIVINTGVKKCYRCLLLHGQRGATNKKCSEMIRAGKPCLCIDDVTSEIVIKHINNKIENI